MIKVLIYHESPDCVNHQLAEIHIEHLHGMDTIDGTGQYRANIAVDTGEDLVIFNQQFPHRFLRHNVLEMLHELVCSIDPDKTNLTGSIQTCGHTSRSPWETIGEIL